MSVNNNGIDPNVDTSYTLATLDNGYINAPEADTYMDAEVTTDFRDPILNKASDFVMAVERLELSLNAIPFYDARDVGNLENILVRSRANPLLTFAVTVDATAYTLPHLFEILSFYSYEDPATNVEFFMTYSINKDGFIVISLLEGMTFTDVQIEFPRRLNQILGISTRVQVIGETQAVSTFPRVDLGDDLDHIIITSNLPTYSDAVGNAKLPILTDFGAPSTYSNSLTYGADGDLTKSGFSTNLRQKLIYTPTERRYLELNGDFPITNIQLIAYYRTPDNEVKKVPLAYGGTFELKLGFYLRQ